MDEERKARIQRVREELEEPKELDRKREELEELEMREQIEALKKRYPLDSSTPSPPLLSVIGGEKPLL